MTTVYRGQTITYSVAAYGPGGSAESLTIADPAVYLAGNEVTSSVSGANIVFTIPTDAALGTGVTLVIGWQQVAGGIDSSQSVSYTATVESAFAWAPGVIPSLVASVTDALQRTVLTFAWPPLVPAGETVDHYVCTLWADPARTTYVPNTTPTSTSVPQVSFSNVPDGVAYLLDVVAVAPDSTTSPAISVMRVSPFVPGEAIGALPEGATVVYPEGQLIENFQVAIRPVYGTYDGVRRWCRVVTFGESGDQVGRMDVEYFLMAASDDIDGTLAGMFRVPLSQLGVGGLFRYPPPIPHVSEMLAASMLLSSRRSVLTESVSTYADSLMQQATAKIQALRDTGYIEGQTSPIGMAPRVYNAAPRQFSMRGDPAGYVWNPVTGSSDLGTFQPHNLPFAGITWRYGSFNPYM